MVDWVGRPAPLAGRPLLTTVFALIARSYAKTNFHKGDSSINRIPGTLSREKQGKKSLREGRSALYREETQQLWRWWTAMKCAFRIAQEH